MGYVKGKKIWDRIDCSTFRTYVKFNPDIPPLVPMSTFKTSDGKTVQVPNKETSSTLYDVWRSKSIEKFLKSMTTKVKLPEIDKKTLLMVAALAIGAILGAYFILMR